MDIVLIKNMDYVSYNKNMLFAQTNKFLRKLMKLFYVGGG